MFYVFVCLSMFLFCVWVFSVRYVGIVSFVAANVYLCVGVSVSVCGVCSHEC